MRNKTKPVIKRKHFIGVYFSDEEIKNLDSLADVFRSNRGMVIRYCFSIVHNFILKENKTNSHLFRQGEGDTAKTISAEVD